MILMRRCVERHKQLPRCLVVDGGKEFRSTYFETLTANYGVTVKRRPPGKARFGSIIERMFGTLNTTFFHTLAGNTQNLRNIRQMTKAMNPKRHAIYSLEDLHDMLSHFAFEFYENRPHPSLNCTPAEKYKRGIEIFGAREHRSIAYDETFRLMTLPATLRGTAKIQPTIGVKINGFYYWSSEMRSRHFEGKSVRVRYDPEDLSVVWAYLGDQWVQCRSNGTLNLDGKTEKEMRLATAEWRRSRQLLGYSQSHSQKAFVQFLKSTEAAKVLRVQQAKDRAMKRTCSPRTNSELPPVSEQPNSHNSAPAPGDPPQPESSKPEPIGPLPQEDYGDLK
jgi:hypothetical protein